MPNPISENLKIGTIGEMLVQIRLLQFGVQANPPIKDSGTDLVAVRDGVFKSVQVKTTLHGRFRNPKLARHCDVVALVDLKGSGNELFLDYSVVYLVPRKEIDKAIPGDL
jgi:hypothetical protein